jgi:predicted negative regulator of RcsB-dependent stress response
MKAFTKLEAILIVLLVIIGVVAVYGWVRPI